MENLKACWLRARKGAGCRGGLRTAIARLPCVLGGASSFLAPKAPSSIGPKKPLSLLVSDAHDAWRPAWPHSHAHAPSAPAVRLLPRSPHRAST
eukprot:479965-Pleurochrysis_carterae.AAC.4